MIPAISPVTFSGRQVDLLRLDQLPGNVSGNKYYKLKFNIKEAVRGGYSSVISFGGAYSNHIHALAAAAKEAGIQSVGYIRGERTTPLNPTLSFAHAMGMELRFVDRETYRSLKAGTVESDDYIVPEGGSNLAGIRGAREILPDGYDIAVVAVGTGGTLCGMVQSGRVEQVLGVRVVKDDSLESFVAQHVQTDNWRLLHGHEWRGYGRYDQELINWMKSFTKRSGILLDPIYTGKLMYAVQTLIATKKLPETARILIVHTGGLQGIAGFNQRFQTDLPENI